MNNNRIHLDLGERSYDILFAALNSQQTVAEFAKLPQKNVLLTADSNTACYIDIAAEALQQSGKTVHTWIFPAGEASKTIDNAMKLCARASELGLGRNALFAALGGGVTGDLTGFAAAIFMRGVPFIQLPTSLLAMVDSSVGGKTAVDTVAGKNLVGAFHQPSLVVIDCNMLDTLPERELGSGMAEIIKTGMIMDDKLLALLEKSSGNILQEKSLLLQVVKRSCEIKAAVVMADEKESGDSGRIFLNYGHTFGHALEHLSHFQLTHGEAVSIGMDIAAYTAVKNNLTDMSTLEKQYALLKLFNIAPDSFADRPIEKQTLKIVEMMKGDKKNGDGRFRAVLPIVPGEVKTIALDPEQTNDILGEYYRFRFGSGFTGQSGSIRPTVAILGLGLLGTSLAMALDRSKYRVTVWSRGTDARDFAAKNHLAEEIFETPQEILAQADIAVICLPVPITEKFIHEYHSFLKPGGILTDVASVKSGVIAAADNYPELHFVGSHPMAGTEKSGCRNGVSALYCNADVFIVPGKYSSGDDLQKITSFWQSLDTHPKNINAADHDKLVAHTSHMLHIIASALTQSILDRSDAVEQRRNYSGCATGFRDTSRIASSSPEMWREICEANTDAILPALDAFDQQLARMRQALIDRDGDEFQKLFQLGRNLRDSWLCYKNARNLPENIVLCGIKHSGKTTVGEAIANILALELTDSDREIEKADPQHRPVREIFIQDGEEKFRKLEAEVLQKLISSPQRRIIALGGGALSNPFVSPTLRERLGFIVRLKTGYKTAFDRIVSGGLPPFLADKEDPFKFFCEMSQARDQIFEAVADAAVETDDSPHRIALHILSLYKTALL